MTMATKTIPAVMGTRKVTKTIEVDETYEVTPAKTIEVGPGYLQAWDSQINGWHDPVRWVDNRGGALGSRSLRAEPDRDYLHFASGEVNPHRAYLFIPEGVPVDEVLKAYNALQAKVVR